jgi:hypothetical protein
LRWFSVLAALDFTYSSTGLIVFKRAVVDLHRGIARINSPTLKVAWNFFIVLSAENAWMDIKSSANEKLTPGLTSCAIVGGDPSRIEGIVVVQIVACSPPGIRAKF